MLYKSKVSKANTIKNKYVGGALGVRVGALTERALPLEVQKKNMNIQILGDSTANY